MAGRGFEMVRYADDFVVLCRSPQEAAAALAVVQRWTAEAGLNLHPDKTRLVDAQNDGFDFLGYRFEAGRRRPRAKSLKKFKDAVRQRPNARRDTACPRSSGTSTARCAAGLNTSSTVTARLRAARRMDSPAAAQHRAQAARQVGDRPRLRQYQVAQCLLCQARAVQLARGPCPSPPVLLQVKPSTGEPDAGDPHVRFGGRGCRTQSALPTPITQPQNRDPNGYLPGFRASSRTSARPSFRQVVIKMDPLRVVGFDQLDFPGSLPLLDLFLAADRSVPQRMNLEPDQTVDAISRREAGNRVGFVVATHVAPGSR